MIRPPGVSIISAIYHVYRDVGCSVLRFIMMTSSNGNFFPRYWPFVRGIHRSPVNSPHKGQWRGALMFSLICVLINGWVNNREAGDLRRHRAHYDVIVMWNKVKAFQSDDAVVYAALDHEFGDNQLTVLIRRTFVPEALAIVTPRRPNILIMKLVRGPVQST